MWLVMCSILILVMLFTTAAEFRLLRELSAAGIRTNLCSAEDMSLVEGLLKEGDFFLTGVLVDTNCPRSIQVLEMASSKMMFNIMHHWMILDIAIDGVNGTEVYGESNTTVALSNKGKNMLSGLKMLPDSEVIWVQVQDDQNGIWQLLDVYRSTKSSPLNVTVAGSVQLSMDIENENTVVSLDMPQRPSTSRRRKCFHGALLRAAAAILYPAQFTGMYDIRLRHVDTWTKITYPILENLAQEFNFSFEVTLTDSYGWQTNGSFDGLMGYLQRGEVELAASAIFMRLDRMPLADFAAETFYIRTAIMFRQPTLSSVSNIFVLPFDGTVWFCCGLLCLVTFATLGLQVFITIRRQIEEDLITVVWSDIATFVLGAICQQGFHITPTSLSGRTTVFILMLTSLFLFTSYSANIVALLQTPSTAIHTVSDLVESPINLGIQDIVYNRVYLKETTDPGTRTFYRRKVAPQGERAYRNASDGMDRIRQGMYGFQVDLSVAYKLISETYTEREKCGLMEVELYPLPTLAFATAKRSGYREMFSQRVRWQREVGILDHLRKIWLPQKPVCENMVSGFVSVGIIDFYPALLVLQYGIVASLVVFVFEFFYFYRSRLLSRIGVPKTFIRKSPTLRMKSARTSSVVPWAWAD